MAVLGMRGTGDYSSDDRPKNYRAGILFKKPNTKAPLTAMTGYLKEEATDDPEFKVFTKDIPTQRTLINGSHNSSITTLTVDSSAQFKRGHVLYNELTAEQVYVVSDPPTATTVQVTRGVAGSTAATMADDSGLIVVGTAHAEGADAPSAISYDTVVGTNMTQIFRTVMEITRTASKTRMRWAPNPWKELKREGLENHGIEIERALIWGAGNASSSASLETTGSNGKPLRYTRGICSWVTTNIFDGSTSSGVLTELDLNEFLEGVFRNGEPEKALFLGGTLLRVINQLAKNGSDFQIDDTKTTYGLNITTWQTAYGKLKMLQHPLMSQSPTFRGWGVIVDTSALKYRYLVDSDTDLHDNIQDRDSDSVKAEYITECGLELSFEDVHGVIKGVTEAGA